jgi:hypothetical protein
MCAAPPSSDGMNTEIKVKVKYDSLGRVTEVKAVDDQPKTYCDESHHLRPGFSSPIRKVVKNPATFFHDQHQDIAAFPQPAEGEIARATGDVVKETLRLTKYPDGLGYNFQVVIYAVNPLLPAVPFETATKAVRW